MAARERHQADNHHAGKPGFSSAALVFDPKQFKANKEVNKQMHWKTVYRCYVYFGTHSVREQM